MDYFLEKKILSLVSEMIDDFGSNGIRENFVCKYEDELRKFCQKKNVSLSDEQKAHKRLLNEAEIIGVY